MIQDAISDKADNMEHYNRMETEKDDFHNEYFVMSCAKRKKR